MIFIVLIFFFRAYSDKNSKMSLGVTKFTKKVNLEHYFNFMEIIHEEFVRGLTFTVKKVLKKSRNGNIQRTVSMKVFIW
jgi:hypothetical protein